MTKILTYYRIKQENINLLQSVLLVYLCTCACNAWIQK